MAGAIGRASAAMIKRGLDIMEKSSLLVSLVEPVLGR
jgi:hypothetical protein